MPITLYGEGNYALWTIKSIKVTEDFTGLGERATNCQTEEFRTDCLTRKYRSKVVETCHCVPFTIRSHFTEVLRTCSSEDLDCVERLEVGEREAGGYTGQCLERCEGTIVDVTKLGSAREETVMDGFIREYQLYKHPLSDNLRQGNIIKTFVLV